MLTNTFELRRFSLASRKKNVLIVDDSLLVLKLIEKYLDGESYNLLFAKNVSEAMEVLDRVTPDIILLDIILPDIDGYNMLKIIKLRQQTQDVPVIFISSLDKGVDISKGLKLGAYDYVIKPFTSNELKGKLSRALAETGFAEL